ncbi:hypothetical protein CISECK363B_21730 [Citrobacter sedlakii]
MGGVILQPGAVQTDTVTADATVGAVAVTLVFRPRFLVGVARHQTKVETVGVVGRPLSDVTAKLHHIAVGLHIQLAAAVLLAGVTTDVAQPQAGHRFLAGQGVDVMGFAQAVVQTGVKHRVRRLQVHTVQTGFRTHRVFARGRCWTLRFRLCWWRHRIDRVQRVYRVCGIYRIDRVYGINRIRIGFRLRVRRQAAGQIPVFLILAFSARQSVVIRPRHDTSALFELAVRISGHADKLDTVGGQPTCAACVHHRHIGGAGSVAVNEHPVSLRTVVTQLRAHDDSAVIARVIAVYRQGFKWHRFARQITATRHSRGKVQRRVIQRQVSDAGRIGHIPAAAAAVKRQIDHPVRDFLRAAVEIRVVAGFNVNDMSAFGVNVAPRHKLIVVADIDRTVNGEQIAFRARQPLLAAQRNVAENARVGAA